MSICPWWPIARRVVRVVNDKELLLCIFILCRHVFGLIRKYAGEHRQVQGERAIRIELLFSYPVLFFEWQNRLCHPQERRSPSLLCSGFRLLKMFIVGSGLCFCFASNLLVHPRNTGTWAHRRHMYLFDEPVHNLEQDEFGIEFGPNTGGGNSWV